MENLINPQSRPKMRRKLEIRFVPNSITSYRFISAAVPSSRVSPTRKINGISRSQLWLLFEAGRSDEGAKKLKARARET